MSLPTLTPSLSESIFVTGQRVSKEQSGGSLSWAPIPPHSAWGQNNLTRGHDCTSHLALLLARLGRGRGGGAGSLTTGLRPHWPHSWLPLHRLHSPSARSLARQSRQPPVPGTQKSLLTQGDLLHAVHLCLSPNHHPGPWSCPPSSSLWPGRGRLGTADGTWFVGAGCPIQGKNQVCFLASPLCTCPPLLLSPSSCASLSCFLTPAAEGGWGQGVYVGGGVGEGRGAGARSWEKLLPGI